jgi:hypothetical protein
LFGIHEQSPEIESLRNFAQRLNEYTTGGKCRAKHTRAVIEMTETGNAGGVFAARKDQPLPVPRSHVYKDS